MRLGVISDTHIPGRARDLPASAWRRLEGCAAILHAGDIVGATLLERLAAVAPVHAVLGNNDGALRGHLPERLQINLGGSAVAMVHDSGGAAGRRARLRRWFPGARVAVFGHSHVPVVDDDGDLLLLNPGSPTDRRRMPTFTMALLHLHAGSPPRAELVDLGRERG